MGETNILKTRVLRFFDLFEHFNDRLPELYCLRLRMSIGYSELLVVETIQADSWLVSGHRAKMAA